MSTGTSPPATLRYFNGLWACRRLYDTARLQWGKQRRFRLGDIVCDRLQKVHWHLYSFCLFSLSLDLKKLCLGYTCVCFFYPITLDDIAKLALALHPFPFPFRCLDLKIFWPPQEITFVSELTVCARSRRRRLIYTDVLRKTTRMIGICSFFLFFFYFEISRAFFYPVSEGPFWPRSGTFWGRDKKQKSPQLHNRPLLK
jgi:hypothetical protein